MTLLLPAPDIGRYLNKVHNLDALELMRGIPSQSIDAIITDLPYGTTACNWDTVIPFAPMWAEVKRVLKPRGVFVTTASQPFTSALVMSNPAWFKYSWVWEKTLAANFFNAKHKPLALHEDVVVFSEGTTANGSPNRMPYYPQGLIKADIHWSRPNKYPSEHNFMRDSHKLERTIEYTGYPSSVLYFPNGNNHSEHPTQKPLNLFKYLTLTYTQPNDLILDFCCGSGTTLVAAQELGRQFIGGDLSEQYCEVARKRLAMPFTKPMFA